MLTFIVAALLAGLAPSTASAETSLCPTAPGSHEYQRALTPLVMGQDARGVARAAVGDQFVGAWFDTPRQGWSVAVAPGAHDLEAARAAIVTAVEARYTPEDAALLTSTLTVLPTPYTLAELDAVSTQVAALAVRQPSVLTGHGIGCTLSYGYRVEVSTPLAETPENVARLATMLGAFGDHVRVEYGLPRLVTEINVATYATMPRSSRCVRGRTVGVRAATDRALRSVTLTAGKRSVTAKRAKRARLALKRRTTRVTLTVRLRDGRTGTQTFTYRLCR